MSDKSEVFEGGPSTSQHIVAEDEDHFQKSTFKLKRTRSLGLLDEFIPGLSEANAQSTTNPSPQSQQPVKLRVALLPGQISLVDAANRSLGPLSPDMQSHQQSSSRSLVFSGSEMVDIPTALSLGLPALETLAPSTIYSTSSALPQSSHAIESPVQSPTAVASSIADSNASSGTSVTVTQKELNSNAGWSESNSTSCSSSSSSSSSNDSTENSSEGDLVENNGNDSVVLVESMLPHDDADITTEPSRHVDYLAYQWDVSDIAKSWRYVIQKRKDVTNAARLENASWRTWAQRRGNLKTISPEVVNWSKDSDVTWLYGPIVKDHDSLQNQENEPEKCSSSDTATSAVAGDISIPNRSRPKPILKKRTVQQSMISHSNLLKLQLATNKVYQKQREQYLKHQNKAVTNPQDHDFNDYDAILAKLNKQYQNIGPSTNSSVTKLQELLNNYKPAKGNTADSSDIIPSTSHVNPSTSATNILTSPLQHEMVQSPSPVQTEPRIRHIHFNEEVQQCIAVDYPEDNFDTDYESDDYNELQQSVYDFNANMNQRLDVTNNFNDMNDNESSDDDDDDYDEDDDEGGFFLKVKSGAPPNLTIAHSKELTEDSDSISTSSSKVYRTIQLLPSTAINYGSSDEESDEENPYTSSMSHNVENRGYDYYYDYNSVYTADEIAYGKKADVVDVPENITLGSNIDYEMIDAGMVSPVQTVIQPKIYTPQPVAPNSIKKELPAVEIPKQPVKTSGSFNLKEDSEDDSSEDEGFSIAASNSSKDLAQSVFGMTSETHFPQGYEQKPVEAPTSTINPRQSHTDLTKQPHSSSSLSSQFFGLTKSEPSSEYAGFLGNTTSTTSGNASKSNDSGLVKQPTSSTGLLDQFNGITKQPTSSSSLSSQFFGTNATNSFSKIEQKSLSDSFFGEQVSNSPSPSNSFSTKIKSNPLPPHTTSANAFLGNSTPPKKTFLFDDGSESDDDEYENTFPSNMTGKTSSYNSLSQVADKSGINSPPQEGATVVGQAKDLANHFLGRK